MHVDDDPQGHFSLEQLNSPTSAFFVLKEDSQKHSGHTMLIKIFGKSILSAGDFKISFHDFFTWNLFDTYYSPAVHR